jgi:hypothetical protein
MILQGFSPDSQAFLQHKRGFTQGQAVAFYGCGIVGPEIPQLDLKNFGEIMVNIVKQIVHKIFPITNDSFSKFLKSQMIFWESYQLPFHILKTSF